MQTQEHGATGQIATLGVHDAVRQRLQALSRGKLLDAPTGFGAMAAFAHGLGFQVTACDLEPEKFEVPEVKCDRVDLNLRLPYEDEQFDVVTCVEGIEHVEHQFGLLRELRRVLRPHGTLIITTPNVSSVTARLRYLATGLLPYFDFDWTLRQWGHITPISAPELSVGLNRAGFAVRDVAGNRIKRAATWLSPLALPIWLSTRRSVTVPDLRKLLTSKAVLFSDILLMQAEAMPMNGG